MRREKDLETADDISKMIGQLGGADRFEAITEISKVVGDDYDQMSGSAREAFDWNLALLLLGRLPSSTMKCESIDVGNRKTA